MQPSSGILRPGGSWERKGIQGVSGVSGSSHPAWLRSRGLAGPELPSPAQAGLRKAPSFLLLPQPPPSGTRTCRVTVCLQRTGYMCNQQVQQELLSHLSLFLRNLLQAGRQGNSHLLGHHPQPTPLGMLTAARAGPGSSQELRIQPRSPTWASRTQAREPPPASSQGT